MLRTILTLIATALASSLALAVSPATPKQILCGSTYIVVGNIVSAAISPVQCGGAGAWGVPCATGRLPGLVNLSVKVTEILGTKDAVTRFPPNFGIVPGAVVQLATYDHRYEELSSTSAQASSDFTGKDFIFSVHIRFGPASSDGTIPLDEIDTPPYWSRIWPLQDRAWITSAIAAADGSSCPR